jgi:hypothetical protein
MAILPLKTKYKGPALPCAAGMFFDVWIGADEDKSNFCLFFFSCLLLSLFNQSTSIVYLFLRKMLFLFFVFISHIGIFCGLK